MARFIVRRMMLVPLILFLLSLATFTMLRVMPGDIACEGFCSIEQKRLLREDAGWNKPYFPVSFDTSGNQDWWLLALPLAALGGYAVGRRRGA